MIKLLFILFNSLILLWPNFVRSDTAIELVEVYLINQLDDQRGYCVDIKGHKSRAKINRGIQAHTCYSYQGEISVDQGFSRKRIMKNEFILSSFNVCIEASSVVEVGILYLKDCDMGKAQKFILMSDGKISLTSNKKLCLTVSQEESRKGGGGAPLHLIRNLSLDFCSDKISNYQKWGLRSMH